MFKRSSVCPLVKCRRHVRLHSSGVTRISQCIHTLPIIACTRPVLTHFVSYNLKIDVSGNIFEKKHHDKVALSIFFNFAKPLSPPLRTKVVVRHVIVQQFSSNKQYDIPLKDPSIRIGRRSYSVISLIIESPDDLFKLGWTEANIAGLGLYADV